MTQLILIGAGGHAKVVLEIFLATGAFDIVGLLDPAPPAPRILGLPVLGGDEVLPRLRAAGVGAAFVALGDNRLRQDVGAQLRRLGFALPAAIHPSSFISPSARIAEGVAIMPRAVIGTEASMAALAIANSGAVIEHDCGIGTAAHVAPACALAGKVQVGARALLGIGCAVRPGISIGDDAVVGAGAAVVSDVPPEATFAGVPARRLPVGSTGAHAAGRSRFTGPDSSG
jgi:UDP-perosamine 4-acetyltransferase